MKLLKARQKKFQKLTGFTLPELLVVMGVIAVLVISSFIGYNIFKKKTQLKTEADEIISTLRLAQYFLPVQLVAGKRLIGERQNNQTIPCN